MKSKRRHLRDWVWTAIAIITFFGAIIGAGLVEKLF